MHPYNIPTKAKLLIIHFEISGNDDKDEYPLNYIECKNKAIAF